MKLYNKPFSSASRGFSDHGPDAFCTNILRCACQNCNFRTSLWTGEYLQMTLMSIPFRGEIGVEMHPDTDQLIRVESGQAIVQMGSCADSLDFRCCLNPGDALFIPGGTWHNVFNSGKHTLKLSSIYAPPQHPHSTVHRTKADSDSAEH